ncbi:unnamed protein product, partial [Iphiclides podalirius]
MGSDAAPAVYVPSRTGKSLLLHAGYTFYLKNLQAHGRKQWYCSSRDMAGCRADVITAPSPAGEGDVLFLVRGRHIHAPPSYYFTPDGKYVRRKDAYHRHNYSSRSVREFQIFHGIRGPMNCAVVMDQYAVQSYERRNLGDGMGVPGCLPSYSLVTPRMP